MPIIVPPYVQYQASLYPLRGLWNSAPVEGDRMVAAEIDWSVTTGPGMAVQFQLSGNSPVAFSQIVAMQVDNTSNAADVQFMFPDSGYTLVVPAYAQVTTPVFTNALQFYAFSPGAVTGDRTLFQVFNSMPPPVAVQQSNQQESAGVAAVPLSAAGLTTIIPAGISGTLEYMSVSVDAAGTTTGNTGITLQDGTGKVLWVSAASGDNMAAMWNIGPVRIGFVNGVNANIYSVSMTGGLAGFNLYYGVP